MGPPSGCPVVRQTIVFRRLSIRGPSAHGAVGAIFRRCDAVASGGRIPSKAESTDDKKRSSVVQEFAQDAADHHHPRPGHDLRAASLPEFMAEFKGLSSDSRAVLSTSDSSSV